MRRHKTAKAELLENKKSLAGREKGKFENRWWGFRSTQGVECSRYKSKLIIPALMRPAWAALDVSGSYSYSGSGAGGGGAWGIVLRENIDNVNLRWLLAWMNSDTIWKWLVTEAELFKGGWRGVDYTILRRVPVRIPDLKFQLEVAKLTEEIDTAFGENKVALHSQIDRLIEGIL